MAYNSVITHAQDINKPIQMISLRHELTHDDALADRFEVTVTSNGQAVDLTGAEVRAYFVRTADNATIMLDGELQDGKACVTLTNHCYAIPGQFCLTIKVQQDNNRRTIYCCTGYLRRCTTDTVVDPTNVVPSLQELLALIETTEQARASAQQVADEVREAYESGEFNFRIFGRFDSITALNAAISTADRQKGDAYSIGTVEPYTTYIWDGAAWVSIGKMAGQGVPPGGDAGQVLAKTTGADYVTHWIDNGIKPKLLSSADFTKDVAVTIGADLAKYTVFAVWFNVASCWGFGVKEGTHIRFAAGFASNTVYGLNAAFECTDTTVTLKSSLLASPTYQGETTVSKLLGVC